MIYLVRKGNKYRLILCNLLLAVCGINRLYSLSLPSLQGQVALALIRLAMTCAPKQIRHLQF
ncbi:MAG: hypothetical protein LBH91_08850 [Prevotellaceae bacterium]|jgi:hypothetical protein|nr:hypothetical protein [Prevotellaceae bacterium]